MKRKRIIMPLIVAFFISFTLVFATPKGINATSTNDIETSQFEESSASNWFDEKIMPYVKETIASFIGGSGGALAVLWVVIKASKKFNSASDDVRYTKEQKEKMEKSIKKFNDSADIVLSNSHEDKAKMEHIEKKQDAIIEVLKLTALNDPTYTKNGVAKKVENIFAKLDEDDI